MPLWRQIEIAHRLGKSIPLGWALDKHGRPTRRPAAMKDDGAMLPLGSDADRSGHKVRARGSACIRHSAAHVRMRLL